MRDEIVGRVGSSVETSESILIDSILGCLRVDFSERGLRRVAFEAGLVPTAGRGERGVVVSGWAEEIRHRAGGGVPRRPLPIDESARSACGKSLDGESFRIRTWRLIERIPHGESVSYGELARRLGSPRAARAVARACADNPLLVVVPCHRVIRGDGKVGGYRGGAESKCALLESEGRAASG